MTFIFDVGGSFQSLTTISEGSYLNVGQEARDFTINPFSLPPTKENLQFLFSFFCVLIEGNNQRYRLDFKEERRLWDAIERIYVLEPGQRTVSNFANIIGELKERLHRWTVAGNSDSSSTTLTTRSRSLASEPSTSTDGVTRQTFWNRCSFMFSEDLRSGNQSGAIHRAGNWARPMTVSIIGWLLITILRASKLLI